MPQTKSAGPEIHGLIRILERMSDLSSGILQAGMAGDESLTRTRVDQLRQEKSSLLVKNRAVGEQLQEAPAEIKQQIQELLNNISKSEQFISAWCCRYRGILDHQALMESPERCDDLVDELIPQSWDWKHDILILPNWVTQALVEALYARGQKRICIFEFDDRPRFQGMEKLFYIAREKDAFDYFNLSDVYASARITYISVATPLEAANEEHRKIEQKLLEDFKMAFVHRIANLNTIKLQGARLLNQGLKNLAAIAGAAPFSKMIGRFQGIPMLIVSPGPSLDKNIDQIKDFKGKALIVAPAQSAWALTSVGVIPDIVVIADPNEMQYLLEGVPMEQVTALILGVTCHPALYEKHTDKIITFNANLGLDAWISDIFNDTTKLPAGGSVSTDALCMGVFLKCSPIILVGQDLSFAEDKQYANASADGQVKIIKNEVDNTISYSNLTDGLETVLAAGGFDGKTFVEPLRTLPGYYGGTVFTKTDYAIFHSEFKSIADAVKRESQGIRLLNCTEGGAYIEGFEHISLSSAKESLRESQINFNITNEIKAVLSSTDVQHRRMQLGKSLKTMRRNLIDAKISAQKCQVLAQYAMKDGSTIKLAAEEKKLITAVKNTLFISLAAQEKILTAIQLGVEAQTIPESLVASNILFRIIVEAVGDLVPVIDDTIREIEVISSFAK